MRLIQTMAGARHGGAEAFFERLAIGLQEAKILQRLVIRGDDDRTARLRAGGCDVVEANFGSMLDFSTRAVLRRVIADFKPNIVLSWMNRATKFCPNGDFVHAARLGGYYDLKYYKNCDHLIGNTHGIVDYILKSGWPAERVHYLPNFVSTEKAAPVSRADFETPDDAPLVLSVGRLHKNKAFDVLIVAIAKIPRLHLWLAGDGPEQAMLEVQAKQLGVEDRVHFLGWRQDIPALLAAADLFVCPSRHEPLGNVVIEAWAAGKPVIAASSDGPREIIKDGENGLLVPIDDAATLAATIQQLAMDRAYGQRLAHAGHRTFEAEFSQAKVVELYKKFFDKIS